jgi:predicted metal-dependent phosphoesterase TrpH
MEHRAMQGYYTIDLHVHTTASDGALAPTEVVRLAHERGVRVIAITDHDSTEGVSEALQEGSRLGVEVIPGIEMSTDIPRAEVHVLGYYVRWQSPELQRVLVQLREARRERGRRMVEKLRALGLDISWERVQAIAGTGAVGRPHVAQALAEAGYVSSIAEAFTRYIGRNAPAYVERYKLTPAEAVQLIRSVGGVPVLAHPTFSGDYLQMLPDLLAAGLQGIEVYYAGYPAETIEALLGVAREHDLVPTGGTDFHGIPVDDTGGTHAELGSVWVPEESVIRLRALAGVG